MYQLSLSGVVFAVGLVLWFRPVLGLLLFHRYRGPAETGTQWQIRERVVQLVAIACIVLASAAGTLVMLFLSPEAV